MQCHCQQENPLRAKAQLSVVAFDVRAEARTLHMRQAGFHTSYDENDEPQPQEREEFGLMKLNPCRIRVSS